ncbi:Shr3 amino acid permease chaperone [Coprinellus micaceus]|uniref:Shr3 amino acid permease chaperone n=1 Tax=Coprinellus micaceus TaxID=71717 RepID=A0A4Y7TRF1_COPMI|nr:Shr3 amino acid permease chaperone [Coprinellus micaceus]
MQPSSPPTSFFLGVLFLCFNVDYQILWGDLTEEVLKDGSQFYTTFFNAPPAIKALLHGMMGVGLLAGVYKLNVWDESAMFFDGSSLAAYVFAIVVYLSVVIPGLRTVADPVKDVDTKEDQIEALRVASAGNIIMIACLTLVLLLQAGQEYARRVDAKALAKAQQQVAVEPTAKKEKKQ